MKRLTTLAPSGSQVAACTRLGATVPPVTSTWYQRGAAKPVVFARRTVCVSHSDSTPPILLYWFCTIARICSTSSKFAVPGCAAFATVAFGQDVAARGVSGPVKVESEVRVQSTWNLYTLIALVNCHVDTNMFG